MSPGPNKAEAEVRLSADGSVVVSTAATGIGTGTWTILTQIGADAFRQSLDRVTVRIGNSSLPTSPVAGGSWTAATVGTVVQAACDPVKTTLFGYAVAMTNSPLTGVTYDAIELADGRIGHRDDPARSLSIAEVMQAADRLEITEIGKAGPDLLQMLRYVSYCHSAVFADVRVDEQLGIVRIHRFVCATAAGKIINPKTARSQILGGVVMGIGMALHEESLTDHRFGKIMNANFGELNRTGFAGGQIA